MANLILVVMMLFATYNHWMVGDKFERLAPSLVCMAEALCSVHWYLILFSPSYSYSPFFPFPLILSLPVLVVSLFCFFFLFYLSSPLPSSLFLHFIPLISFDLPIASLVSPLAPDKYVNPDPRITVPLPCLISPFPQVFFFMLTCRMIVEYQIRRKEKEEKLNLKKPAAAAASAKEAGVDGAAGSFPSAAATPPPPTVAAESRAKKED